MRINRENTVGLVIDIQEKLLPSILYQEQLRADITTLLLGLKIFNLPIIVAQQNTKGLGHTIPEISKALGNFTYIEKSTFSCFREPAFSKVLSRIGKRNVIIMGIETHICVLQTALDLLYNNYNPVIVEDCIGSARENDQRVALWRMRDVGVMVTTCESVLFELCRESGTDEFKALLKLIKERKNA
jgi:nicotinamidase-related amidase